MSMFIPIMSGTYVYKSMLTPKRSGSNFYMPKFTPLKTGFVFMPLFQALDVDKLALKPHCKGVNFGI
jgi:hypothetical protein